MEPEYSFQGGMSLATKAQGGIGFIVKFSLVYAAIASVFMGIVIYLASGPFMRAFGVLEALEGTPDSEIETALSAVSSTLWSLWPYFAVSMIGFWVLWAVFESASQRRYVRDQGFSIGFGADELRIMAVGIFWMILYSLCFLLPFGIMLGGMFGAMFAAVDGSMSESEIEMAILGSMGFGMLVFLFTFFIYVFFATRFAPATAMTIKDRKVKFFDAWRVSRGKFWPILGGFIILSVAVGIVSSVVNQIGQALVITSVTSAAESGNMDSLAASPLLWIGGIIFFVVYFAMIGAQMHIVGAPAAYAARHDPLDPVDAKATVDVFT